MSRVSYLRKNRCNYRVDYTQFVSVEKKKKFHKVPLVSGVLNNEVFIFPKFKKNQKRNGDPKHSDFPVNFYTYIAPGIHQ